MKSWRGYIFTSVCLSVCVSVCMCVCVFVNKIQPNGCTNLDAVANCTGSDPIEIGDLGLKVKVTVTENVSKNDEKIR